MLIRISYQITSFNSALIDICVLMIVMIPGFTVINNQNLHSLLDKVNFSSVLKEALIKKLHID